MAVDAAVFVNVSAGAASTVAAEFFFEEAPLPEDAEDVA
jgi:hypothetical protein